MTLQAWHFVRDDRTLRDGTKLRVGKVLRLPKGQHPALCKRGFHASERAIDALTYAHGAVICRVELRGEIVTDSDKAVASERKVLWAADATRTLHLFALSEARRALMAERKAGREPDPRSWKALRVKRLWLDGKATDQERGAAGAAARAAARAAAWEAARAAAWEAARAAAWEAAGAAAWEAAGAAAGAAARAAADKRLTKALVGLAP